MLTVQKLQDTVQRLQQVHIPRAKARRFRLGVQQFSLKEHTSLNSAGRTLGVNRWTGENRIRRVVTDRELAGRLQRLLVDEALAGRQGYLYCSLDHSQFGPFCIAVLAVSVRRGRAIPLWCQVNQSEAALIGPLLTALETLLADLHTTAPGLQPVFVMDRWFAADTLLTLLAEHQAYCIVRTKTDKLVRTPWDGRAERTPIGEVSPLETAVTYRSHRLRLVRSEVRAGMRVAEPWFLLTDLPPEVTRRQVLNRYAERFEIEEAFKDLKWLNRLQWQRIRKPTVIHSLLLFVFLGWWLLWTLGDKPDRRPKIHLKKRLSWFRITWEHVQTLLQAPAHDLLL